MVITNVWPSIDDGRYPVKRVVGERLEISADVFKDGHDVIYAVIRWRKAGRPRWEETAMVQGENDRWHGECTFFSPGNYEYTIQAWPDWFRSWKHEFEAKHKAGQEDLSVEIEEGALLLDAAAERATAAGDNESSAQLASCAETIREVPTDHIVDLVLSEELQTIMDYWPNGGWRRRTRRHSGFWWRTSGRGFRRGTNFFRGRRLGIRKGTRLFATVCRGWMMRRRWDSMWSTCRRSTRSGRRRGRGRTTR